jgi:methionyl-tRNA formyltransferase
MAARLKLAFFGLPLAAWLLGRDGHDVVLAVLSPIAGAPGRRRLVRQIGADRLLVPGGQVSGRRPSAGLPDDERAFDSLVDERLARAGADLLVSWFWTRKLPARWIESARLGGIGVHPSLLPRHRGPDPYFAAIDAGDPTTGVTLHVLTAEYDDGPILLESELSIGDRDAWQLARALDRPSLRVLREGVQRLAGGPALHPIEQETARATWAAAPEGPLLRVTWSWPTERVLRRIRALSPVPGLALELVKTPLFVTRAEPASEVPTALLPGEAAVQGEPPARVVIRTGDGAIAVTRVVLAEDGDPGGRELDAQALAALVAGARTARS